MDYHGACFAFQPILRMDSHSISAYKALIRGKEGESAQQVLECLSKEDLFQFDLDSKSWALETAANLGVTCNMALSLLPQTLLFEPGVVSQLLNRIYLYGFKPGQVVIELTEQAFSKETNSSDDLNSLIQVIHQLQGAGVRIALSAYGASPERPSFQTLLAAIKPVQLKIDRSITTGVDKDKPHQSTVGRALEICHRLGIPVVAEGVQTLKELRWLNKVGINDVQGFLFAKPLLEGLPTVDWNDAKTAK